MSGRIVKKLLLCLALALIASNPVSAASHYHVRIVRAKPHTRPHKARKRHLRFWGNG